MKKFVLMNTMLELVGMTPNVEPTGLRKRKSESRKNNKNGHNTYNHENTVNGAVGKRNNAYGVHWLKG